jgi:hypothetical protein
MAFIFHLILWLFSRYFILSFSDDDSSLGGPIEFGKKISRWRFSLLSFGLGSYKFYLVSCSKEEKFVWYKIEHILDINCNPDDIMKDSINYVSQYRFKNEINIDVDISYWSDFYSQYADIKNRAYLKLGVYLTVLAFLAPEISGLFSMIHDLYVRTIVLIIVCIILLNIFLWVGIMLSTRKINRSDSNDLHSTNVRFRLKNNKLSYLKCVYFNVHNIKHEAELDVGYVKIIGYYMILFIVMISILGFCSEIKSMFFDEPHRTEVKSVPVIINNSYVNIYGNLLNANKHSNNKHTHKCN